MALEDKMIVRLQQLVDHMKEAREEGNADLEKIWHDYYTNSRMFVEDVTGKFIVLEKGVVRFK